MILPYPLWFKSPVGDCTDVTDRRAGEREREREREREYSPAKEPKGMGCWMVAVDVKNIVSRNGKD